jgi:hypothetical protein
VTMYCTTDRRYGTLPTIKYPSIGELRPPTPVTEINLRSQALARQKKLWGLGAAVHRPPHPAMHSVLRISAHPLSLQADVIEALAGPLEG